MTRTFISLLILISNFSLGQSISVIYPTPTTSVDNNTIDVFFSTNGNVQAPYSIKLYKAISYQFQSGSCGLSNSSTEILNTTSTSTTKTLALPSGMEASGSILGQTFCGYTANYYKTTDYYLVISSGNTQSDKYYIQINPQTTGSSFKTLSLSSTQICQGSTLNISFKHQNINAGNTFTIDLSDQYGSFTTPIATTTVSGNTATSASLAIPSNAPYNSSYKVRISSSDPSASIISGKFLIGIYPVSIYVSSSYCEGSKLSISASTYSFQPESAYTFVWKKDNVVLNNNQSTSTDIYTEYYDRTTAQLTDAGVYSLSVSRNSDGCSVISNTQTIIINTAPNPPTTSPITVISGNTANLTASNCAGTIYWYNSTTSDNNNYLGSGTYTTPELSQQTTFYAACRDNSGAYCYSTRTPLVVSIDATNAPNPPSLTASDNNFCSGSVQNPKITASGCSGTVRWYRKDVDYPNSSYSLYETDTEAPYEYNISNYYSYYYAADCRVNGVLSTTKSEVLINVKPIPSSPNVSPSYGNINNGSTLSLTASNCSGTVKWYADNTITTPTSTGLLFTTPTLINNDPNNTVYYYIYYSCTVNGCESYRSNSSFGIYNSIQSPTISYEQNTSNVCSGNTKTLYANGCSNGTVNWYDNYSNGNLLGTGQSFTTPTLTYNNSGSNSYYYYADCTIGGNTSSRNSGSVYVYKQPTTPSANQPTIACGATASLTATGCNTSSPDYFGVYWYASATATSSLSSGSNYTTPNLSATTTYYVECRNSSCVSARMPISVTVSCTPPNAPVISSNLTAVCAGGSINLSATGCSGTVNWSDGGSGTSRTNVIFNASLSLSATCTVGGLTSGASNVLAITINPKPSLVITNPAAVAPPNTVDMTAASITTGSTLPSGTTLSYFTDANATLTLNNPNAVAVSGTYYIKATSTAGCTDIKPVLVTINNCSSPIVLVSTADDYNAGTQLKKTNETITATNKITAIAQATYRSNKSILLNAGFKAEPTAGGYFKGEIGGCE